MSDERFPVEMRQSSTHSLERRVKVTNSLEGGPSARVNAPMNSPWLT